MIPKLDSNELNKILINAQETAVSTAAKIETIKNDIEKKLVIMNYESDYVNSILSKMNAGGFAKAGNLKTITDTYSTTYSKYGSTVHASMIREPVNVFNLKIAGTGEVFFRDDMKVTVEGKVLDKYKDILKHESLPRETFFEKFDSPNVKIEIEALELSKMLGPTKFNMIEISPFLNGSFDITSIEIFKYKEDGEYDSNPDTYEVPSCGKLRLILPEKVSFYKIIMNVKINFESDDKDNKVYPFGLKHIYFYDADYRADSYAIMTIKSDKNIASINDAIKMKTPNGISDTTMKEQGLIVYIDNNNGMLETPIPTSTPNQTNTIARDIKTLYVQIPLYGKSIIGFEYFYETK